MRRKNLDDARDRSSLLWPKRAIRSLVSGASNGTYARVISPRARAVSVARVAANAGEQRKYKRFLGEGPDSQRQRGANVTCEWKQKQVGRDADNFHGRGVQQRREREREREKIGDKSVYLFLSCFPRVLRPREQAGTSCSTPIARTGRSPPFPPSPPPPQRLDLSTYLSVCLSCLSIHDRAWRTYLDD